MEATRGPFEAGRRAGIKEGVARTLAHTFCFVAGAALVAAGVLGFIFGGDSFSTGGTVVGEEFIGLEVNGWHNVVHIATGALLLLASASAVAAATGALVFGIAYAGVAAWGFIDEPIANAVAINDADNWLHVGLAAAGIVVGVSAGALGLSARRDRHAVADEDRIETTDRPTVSTDPADAPESAAAARDPNLPPVSSDPRTTPEHREPS